MKDFRLFPYRFSLAVLSVCLFSALSLQAQTFDGGAKLVNSPHLEAAIYPVSSYPSAIKVVYNNRTGGSVRVVIKNDKGRIFYDEFEKTPLYRRRFDLSELPQGNYIVELSKQEEHFAQSLSIESPFRTNIAMMDVPIQNIVDRSTETKMVSKE
ncbi:hypothetical protein [Spirosoma gilvum]